MSRFIQLARVQQVPRPDAVLEHTVVFDAELVRRAMVALGRYACDGGVGRNEGDPVFDEITEGRQKDPDYSTCADLIHWCLRRLGLRDERVLNRTDDGGEVPWRMVVNVARLVYSTGKAFHWSKRGEGMSGTPWQVQEGNMGLIGENGKEHVFVVEEVDPKGVWLPNDRPLLSCDYGQFFRGKHGGARRSRRVVSWHGRLYLYSNTLPGRPWMGQLDVAELLRPYFLRNELAAAELPDDFEGGLPSDNPY